MLIGQRILIASIIFIIIIIILLILQSESNKKSDSEYINSHPELRNMLETTNRHVNILLQKISSENTSKAEINNEKYLLYNDFYVLQSSFNEYSANITKWNEIAKNIENINNALNSNESKRKTEIIKYLKLEKNLIEPLLKGKIEIFKLITKILSSIFIAILIALNFVMTLEVTQFINYLTRLSDKIVNIGKYANEKDKESLSKEFYLLGINSEEHVPRTDFEIRALLNRIKMSITEFLNIEDKDDFPKIFSQSNSINTLINDLINESRELNRKAITGLTSFINYFIALLSLIASYTNIIENLFTKIIGR